MLLDLTPEIRTYITGAVVGMYFLTTLVLGLQLTCNILRMRKPNLLTFVTGVAMLLDSVNVALAFIVFTHPTTINKEYAGILSHFLDATTFFLLISVGDLLQHKRFPWARNIVCMGFVVVSIMVHIFLGETMMTIAATPLLLMGLYFIVKHARNIFRSDRNMVHNYSNIEHRSKKWYIWILSTFAIELTLWAWAYIVVGDKLAPKLIYCLYMVFFWLLFFRFTTMQRLMPEEEGEEDSDDNYLPEVIEECASETSAEETAETTDGATDPKEPSPLLQRMEQLMKEKKLYLNSDLTLVSLAHELDSNRTYVSQIFNKELHVTFYQYINRLRVEHAIRLIVETDDKLSAIAYESGFSTPASMVRIMREYTGMTPTQVRINGGG